MTKEKHTLMRRDFLRNSGLAIGAGLLSLMGTSCPNDTLGPSVKKMIFQLPCDWHDNGKLSVGVWYNDSLEGPQPTEFSSHGYFANLADLSYTHNFKAMNGITVIAPDHEDLFNIGRIKADEKLKSYASYPEILKNFGSINNYVQTVLFAPYDEEEKKLINIDWDLLSGIFGETLNQINQIPGYESVEVMELPDLLNRSLVGDIQDPKFIKTVGDIVYGSRCRDISYLIDACTGDNQSGDNPSRKNYLYEKTGVEVDVEKIVGEGYSAGGGTMLRLCGANNDSENGEFCYEPRLRSISLYAPSAGLNLAENFPSIDKNILWIIGENDGFVKSVIRRQPLTPKSKQFITLANAGHLSISGIACEGIIGDIMGLIPKAAEKWGTCESHDGVARVISEYPLQFFQEELGLKGEKQTDLITQALSDPAVYFATDMGVTSEDIHNYFPEYEGKI